MKKILIVSFINIAVCILGQLPAIAGNCPDRFVGPKPGMAVVFQYSSGGMPTRMIGMEVDEKGKLRVLHEMELPEKTIPYPTRTGQFLTHGYFQQFFHAVGEQVFFSEERGGDSVAYLDLSQNQWTEHIPLVVGCSDSTPESECPAPPTDKTKVTLRILSRSSQIYLGEQREVIKVALDVRTKEFGTAGSTTLFFVTGIGMFTPELPQNARIEHLSDEELQAVDKQFNVQLKAYREQATP